MGAAKVLAAASYELVATGVKGATKVSYVVPETGAA